MHLICAILTILCAGVCPPETKPPAESEPPAQPQPILELVPPHLRPTITIDTESLSGQRGPTGTHGDTPMLPSPMILQPPPSEEALKRLADEIRKKQLEQLLPDPGAKIRPPLRSDFRPEIAEELIRKQYEKLLVNPSPSSPDAIPGLPDGFQPMLDLDVDRDGRNDLVVERRFGRGPLSTYFSAYRLRALDGVKILRGGAPLAEGDSISIFDIAQGTEVAALCSVGNSLRYPNESFEKFSGGTWWGADQQALGVAITRGDRIRIGYVRLSVSKTGDVTVHDIRLVEVRPASVRVEGDARSRSI